MPVSRVRAVRVVEGIFRRPFGLAALTVEVTGYAEEASAARTLFPLLRLSDVEAFLQEFLPELADDPRGLPPAAPAPPSLLHGSPLLAARCHLRRLVRGRPARPNRAARRRSTAGALARRRLAPPGRPPRDPLDAPRPDHGPRPRALPRIPHARPERTPAPRTSPTSRSPSARRPPRASATWTRRRPQRLVGALAMRGRPVRAASLMPRFSDAAPRQGRRAMVAR